MPNCELEEKPCIAVQNHYLNFPGIPVCTLQALTGKPFVIAEMKRCPKGNGDEGKE